MIPIDHVEKTALILTTYLTTTPDPQRRVRHKPDDPRKLSLVDGADRLGYPCIIMHDELSPAFVDEHATGNIAFVKVRPPPELSCNDARFMMYRHLLEMAATKPETVWCVDLFDVKMNRSPDFLIERKNHGHRLWISHVRGWGIDTNTPDGNWVIRKLTACYGRVPPCCVNQPILSAGVWGGCCGDVLEVLGLLVEEVSRVAKRHYNCNMGVFNKVLRERYGPEELWTEGQPLHSEFRANQFDAPVCFVHK